MAKGMSKKLAVNKCKCKKKPCACRFKSHVNRNVDVLIDDSQSDVSFSKAFYKQLQHTVEKNLLNKDSTNA